MIEKEIFCPECGELYDASGLSEYITDERVGDRKIWRDRDIYVTCSNCKFTFSRNIALFEQLYGKIKEFIKMGEFEWVFLYLQEILKEFRLLGNFITKMTVTIEEIIYYNLEEINRIKKWRLKIIDNIENGEVIMKVDGKKINRENFEDLLSDRPIYMIFSVWRDFTSVQMDEFQILL